MDRRATAKGSASAYGARVVFPLKISDTIPNPSADTKAIVNDRNRAASAAARGISITNESASVSSPNSGKIRMIAKDAVTVDKIHASTQSQLTGSPTSLEISLSVAIAL